MTESEAHTPAGQARERIGEILRTAIGTPDEAALEDETRRLMLHLSIEPLANSGSAPLPAASEATQRRPLLRRLLRKPDGQIRA